MAINNRQSKLLDFIIRQYVKTGEPVGSETFCQNSKLNVSSATIRSEMAELEDLGYLRQPHTSAGRIPTDKAYRYFVNRILEENDLRADTHAKRRIDYALGQAGFDPYMLNRCIANVLFELTDSMVFTAIEDQDDFFKVGLASMFSAEGEFASRDLPRHIQRMSEMATFFDDFDRIFQHIEQAFFGDMDRPYHMEVRIGRENPMEEIRHQAVLVARYPLPHNLTGAVTVIGPTRMDYERTLGIVDYATQALRRIAKEA